MIVAEKPPTEIQTLIDNHINAFNTQNNELFFVSSGKQPSLLTASRHIAG